MPARLRMIVRSYPGRTAAAVVAVLLASGAVVAAFSGREGYPGEATTSLSSSTLTSGGAARSEGYGSSPNEPASAAPAKSPAAPVPNGEAARQAAPGGVSASRSGGGAAADRPAEAPVSPGVGPAGLGGQPLPAAVAAGTARIVKNATLSVNVKKGGLGDSYQQAVDAAAAVGGWVQASQTGTDQATLTLKVPSDKLAGVIGTIRGLGTVTAVSETGEDVTAEYVDLEARIGHWRAQEAVFVGLMAKAKTIPETIQIQQQLSTIQEQIEQLEGRRRLLDGQTSFSTVRLTLLEEGAVTKPDDTRPKPESTLSRSWERAGRAALAVLGGTIVVLGVLAPLTAIIGIPAWALTTVLRRRSSRRRETAPAQG